MSFGKDLKGKSSHEAIVHIQDVELRLLETLQHFISMHIDNDKKYNVGLSKMLIVAQKFDTSEFRDCCNVFKVCFLSQNSGIAVIFSRYVFCLYLEMNKKILTSKNIQLDLYKINFNKHIWP